ncbi:interferon-induced protein 44-like [Hypanus sabinus]|uniref:interferon-induced protein 44-like n=1 Tax=Hypanus sabinus TaxID=79690 RepID=UPI0028C4965A|nr:interferon-induced protein 44-like [Hypanus sabinus]
MSVIISHLTEEDLKLVFEILGEIKLHLLYKASVHGFSKDSFNAKCSQQGPTLTVGYVDSNYIFGGYITKDVNYSVKDNKAFLFQITGKESTRVLSKFDVNPGAEAFTYSKNGICFGDSLVFLFNNKPIMKIRTGKSYNLDYTGPICCDKPIALTELETYRVEELKVPLRKMDWSPRRKDELLDFVKTYNPFLNSSIRPTILLIGPLGAGKSSFINSVDSVFHDYVTNRAFAGNTTTKFSKYSFQAEKATASLILCDTLGLAKDGEFGISDEQIINILNGLIPNQHQFNSPAKIEHEENRPTSPTVHCVAYVIDASQSPILPRPMKKRMLDIQSQIKELDIPQIVLLTKVDKACSLVEKDLKNVYRSEHITKKIMEVGEQLRIPVSCIVPVNNYWFSDELDCVIDILLLSAIKLMLQSVNSCVENMANLSLG